MYKAVLEHLLSKTMKNESDRRKNQQQQRRHPGESTPMENEPVRCSRDRLHISHLHTFFHSPSVFLPCNLHSAIFLSLSLARSLARTHSRLPTNKKSLKENNKEESRAFSGYVLHVLSLWMFKLWKYVCLLYHCGSNVFYTEIFITFKSILLVWYGTKHTSERV